MRVLVYGAGVIGQIYGGRLARAGHDVTLLARGSTFELLQKGAHVRTGDESLHVRPRVISEVPSDARYDVVLVTVRRDQFDKIVPALEELPADRMVMLLNPPGQLLTAAQRVGTDRTVFAFPGVGGQPSEDGTIDYLEIPQQKTTVGRAGGSEERVAALMRSAGFGVDVIDDMEGWLKTHTIFVTGIGAAILASDGDPLALAADSKRVATMVAAVGEGFRALAAQGVTVTPTPLRLIFTRVPRFIAVRYWQRQLRGPVAIAPHVRATRDSEFPDLSADARRLVGGREHAPHLDQLLATTAQA